MRRRTHLTLAAAIASTGSIVAAPDAIVHAATTSAPAHIQGYFVDDAFDDVPDRRLLDSRLR